MYSTGKQKQKRDLLIKDSLSISPPVLPLSSLLSRKLYPYQEAVGEFDLVNLMRVCNGLVNQLQPQAVRRLRMLNSWGPIGRHKEGGLRMRNS